MPELAAAELVLEAPEPDRLMEIVARVRDEVQPGAAAAALDRSNCLPPDLDYSLDCEQEWGGIGQDDRAFVQLFDQNTLSWFLPLTRGNARAFPDIVKRRHADWRRTAAINDRMALDWGGLKALRWLFDDVVNDFGYDLIYRQGVGDLPENLTAAVVVMDVQDHPCLRRFTDCAAPILQRSLEDLEIAGRTAFMASRDRLDELYAQQAAAIREKNRRINSALRRYAENSIPQAIRMAEGGVPVRTIEQKRKEKRLRKAISRSFTLLTSVAGRRTARACIDGEAIAVEGEKFDFRLRVANLRSTAHGAIEVFVTDKDAVELAALCVYIDETPALDQMAALILNVTSGNEDEIIRRANVIRSTQAAAENRHFREIRERVDQLRRQAPPIATAAAPPSGRDTPEEEFLPTVRLKLADEIDRRIWHAATGLLGNWLEFADAA